jgi:predicted alpha/beta-hydrolase family hydrolase
MWRSDRTVFEATDMKPMPIADAIAATCGDFASVIGGKSPGGRITNMLLPVPGGPRACFH